MAGVEVELRAMMAADDEIALVVHQFAAAAVERLALMRAGVFKAVNNSSPCGRP